MISSKSTSSTRGAEELLLEAFKEYLLYLVTK